MEKKGNKLIGLFDAQAQVLIKVGELKAAGYEEEELYLVSNHDEQIHLLIDHTAVHVDTQDRDNFKGKVIAFLAGEDITKDAFNRMGLHTEETDHYFRQVENGKLLLYTNSEPASAPQPEAALRPDRESDLPTAGSDTEEQHLALHEEQLSIDKEKVQTGKIQVQKQLVEEDREIQVPVEREEIVIDRRPLSAEMDTEKDEQVLTPKQAYEKGDAIYIPLSEERLDIGKKKVIREEIVIGKRKVKDVQVINETVRREVADVEETGDVKKVEKP
ncbi:hypothetical protein A1A1_15788 [Planococcus antarcticus DSM 14505]|uniref:Stress response protein ysnF n=1 Tax=Planococcus antarcticus DSM 14505 TaxID=1185653 RepID=A0A1C7DEL7_9BACL|nr:YsnF/AvaK domain-containing protein [Planococcus antarcticus]ANU09711.1 hypothetical protein BBH88_05070 [Planococcus antarcticus DSM 14505]EIM05547.1 hypothetical protein A1A1_15788 [Planococcus antarcticus DSM 14505]